MESFLFLSDLLTAHEPGRRVVLRVPANRQVGSTWFMERHQAKTLFLTGGRILHISLLTTKAARQARRLMKTALLICGLLWLWRGGAAALPERMSGLASWYGESHRGRPMADGAKFNPDDLTAASWFYPLGTRVRVTLRSDPQRSVLVTITDRGPARRLVAEGRVIDLARAAFRDIAPLSQGLADVTVEPVKNTEH